MFATDTTTGQSRGGVVELGTAAVPCTVGTLKLIRCRFAKQADVHDVHVPNMTGFLRTAVHLHTLEIQVRSKDAPVQGHLMAALRQNGSLRTVRYERDLHLHPVTIGRYLSAITARNQMTRHLLKAWPENPAGDDCDDAKSIASCSHQLVALCPTLFAVAKQAPRMALNTLLIGLLATNDGIGPGLSVLGKRKVRQTNL
jgi:hypothetical protein